MATPPLPAGYTQEEKIEIAHRHLIPKQLGQHGLTPQQIQIPQVTTLDIITRWAGPPSRCDVGPGLCVGQGFVGSAPRVPAAQGLLEPEPPAVAVQGSVRGTQNPVVESVGAAFMAQGLKSRIPLVLEVLLADTCCKCFGFSPLLFERLLKPLEFSSSE